MFTLSQNSKNNRAGIDHRLIEISDLAIKLTIIDFGHGRDAGLRTAIRQNELFLKELSKADGYEKKSNHQTGNALDFYAFVDGKASWEHEHLAMVATAFFQAASMLSYQIKWGGLWRSEKSDLYGWDMPHIELL